MTVASVAVATMKFLSGMRDCMVDSDFGTSDYSLVLGILHVRSHVSPGMDCNHIQNLKVNDKHF